MLNAVPSTTDVAADAAQQLPSVSVIMMQYLKYCKSTKNITPALPKVREAGAMCCSILQGRNICFPDNFSVYPPNGGAGATFGKPTAAKGGLYFAWIIFFVAESIEVSNL